MRAIIKKVGINAKFIAPTPSMADYKPGQDNPDISLPIEYEVEGELLADIEVGKGIRMARKRRNDVSCPSLFATSPITSWDGKIATTLNSVYHVEMIEEN